MTFDTQPFLELAIRQLHGGNFAVADLVCRDILDAEPHNADALNLLGIVAARINEPAKAAEYFQAALQHEPGFQQAAHNLSKLGPARPMPQSERFLVIKAWGCGFWSDVAHLLGALLLAELTGRTPVTHWGTNSLFGDGKGDAFRLYFDPVSPWTLDDIPKTTFFPAKWSSANVASEDVAKWDGTGARQGALQFFGRTETVAVSDFYCSVADLLPWIPVMHRLYGLGVEAVYRDLTARYLRPRTHITEAVEHLRRELLDDDCVAVHLRGSDKEREMDWLDDANARYFETIDRLAPASRLFLLTDDSNAVARFKGRYGSRLVTANCLRTSTSTGIHMTPGADRQRLGFEVVRDVYAALTCRRFIGNGASNVSAMIAVMKDWPAGASTMLVPSQFTHRSTYLHFAPA